MLVLTCDLGCQVHEELLTSEEADECISIEFNPVRAGFHGSHDHDVWTQDVLNLGVKPDKLIDKVTPFLYLLGRPALQHQLSVLCLHNIVEQTTPNAVYKLFLCRFPPSRAHPSGAILWAPLLASVVSDLHAPVPCVYSCELPCKQLYAVGLPARLLVPLRLYTCVAHRLCTFVAHVFTGFTSVCTCIIHVCLCITHFCSSCMHHTCILHDSVCTMGMLRLGHDRTCMPCRCDTSLKQLEAKC